MAGGTVERVGLDCGRARTGRLPSRPMMGRLPSRARTGREMSTTGETKALSRLCRPDYCKVYTGKDRKDRR